MYRNQLSVAGSTVLWHSDLFRSEKDKHTLQHCLDALKEIPVSYCEISESLLPQDPNDLKRLLLPRDLKVCSLTFDSQLANPGRMQQTILRFKSLLSKAIALDCKTIVVREMYDNISEHISVSLSQKKSLQGAAWLQFTTGLTEIVKLAQEHRIKIVYYPYMGTLVQTKDEFMRLIESKGLEKMQFVFNPAQFIFTGIDPGWVIKEYAQQIGLVYLCDIDRNIMARALAEDWSYKQSIQADVFISPGNKNSYMKSLCEAVLRLGFDGYAVMNIETVPNHFIESIEAPGFLSTKTNESVYAQSE